MGVEEIRADLSYLAVDRNAAASTRKVAFNAFRFLDLDGLMIDLALSDRVEPAKKPATTMSYTRVAQSAISSIRKALDSALSPATFPGQNAS